MAAHSSVDLWALRVKSGSFGAKMSLRNKLLKHYNARNVLKLINYVDVCIRAGAKLVDILGEDDADNIKTFVKGKGYKPVKWTDGKVRCTKCS